MNLIIEKKTFLVMYKIPLSDVDIGKAEIQAVLRVLKSKWLTLGEVTAEFEQEFARYIGVREAVAVSSGTAALHLAYRVLNIGPGDEVIVPSMTFVATVNAVLYCGATPVFADIKGLDDLNITPEEIDKKITPRTKAVCVVHYGGYPADMDHILNIANRHRIRVVEDAAHGVGAELNGKKIGALGDIGCFSFFSNKNMITGEGGMFVTQDPDLSRRARRLRSHGMTSLSWDRFKGHASNYDVTDLGFNYRINELASAIGRVQLRKLERNNRRRAMAVKKYQKSLTNGNGLIMPFCQYRGKPSHHLFPVILKNQSQRDRLQIKLREAGIQTSIHYPPVHLFEYYKKKCFVETGLPITEDVSARELSLPLFAGITQEQIRLVTTTLIKNIV